VLGYQLSAFSKPIAAGWDCLPIAEG